MNKKLPSWIALCVVCVCAVFLLGLANNLTAGRIEQQAAKAVDATRASLLEGTDHFEALELQSSRYSLDNLYAGRDASGAALGYVGQTTVSGYGGPVEVTAAIDPEGVITGISVGGEDFAETPGLGELTREPAFTSQFAGKVPNITLNEDGVDTVSGASTTSRAVVSGVNTIANYVRTVELGMEEEAAPAFVGQTFSATEQGFAGDVTVHVGFNDDQTIAYLAIDTPDETDGLGKMASETGYTGQFIGKTGPFTYGEDGIEAITGATFTSTAAINAINTVVSGGGTASAEPVSTTVQGFGGEVTVTAMLNDDNTVAALAIDTPNETDGLGKMTSEPAFTNQFVGKAAPFTYGEDGIEAVSGATITSTAVINALNSIVPAADGTVSAPAAVVEAPAEEANEVAPAEEAAPVEGESVTFETVTAFSTIHIDAVVNDGRIVDCKITSEPLEGQVDMLTDESRAALAAQIVEKQDVVDAISGVTVSSDAIKAAVADILGQGTEVPAEEEAAEEVPAEEANEEAPAEEAAPVEGESVTFETVTAFSTIHIDAVVNDGKIVDCKITSEPLEGQVDMLTDESRAALAAQIIEKQDVDAISGVTVSSDAIKAAIADILGQGAEEAPAEAEAVEEAPTEETAEEAPVEEAPAEAEAVEGEAVTFETVTAFSTIHIDAVVNDGKIVDCKITSEPLEGQVDMLTDESRAALAAQIVEKQDVVDAISGVTVSSDAIKAAVADILGQSAEEAPAEAEGAEEAPAEAEAVEEAPTEETAEEAPVEEAPAEAEAVEGEAITFETVTAFSTIHIDAVVNDGKIVDCKITSEPLEGQVDMLTDESRAALAAQIIEKQDVDAISGVTVSSDAIKAAVADILGQGPEEVPAEETPAEETTEEATVEETAAEAAPVEGESVAFETVTAFSTIHIDAVVNDGKIVDCKITSEPLEGQVDMLTDESRAALAAQIVEKQDVDAISGVTVSSDAIKAAVADILGQGAEEAPAEAEAAEAPAEEAPAEAEVTEESAVEGDAVNFETVTAFSTIHIDAVVNDGKIVDCKITSEPLEGQVDMLTDESRAALAAQIVEKQDVDAITGVTVSSDAIKAAVADILGQGAEEAPAEAEEALAEEAPAEEETAAEAPAEAEVTGESAVEGESVAFETVTAFSTIHIDAVVNDGKIVDCKITSEPLEGQVDMLTDESRAALAAQIVEKQDVDAISGVTVSSDAIKAAVADILGQGAEEAPAEAEEALAEEAPAEEETAAEAPAEEANEEAPAEEAAPVEGESVTFETVTAFSTIHIDAVVNDGRIVDCKITSEPLEGQVDMLTDESRAALAAQIVEKQDVVDAISGVTVSSDAIKAAVADILGQGGYTDGAYTAQNANSFSTIDVALTIEGGRITDAKITSDGGENDLLTDALRAEWAKAIVESQSADNDAISGATLTFSAGSVKAAVEEILAQAAK